MNLSDLLEPGLIKVPVESMTRDEVIAELVEQLVRQDKIGDRGGVLDTLYERERKGSTGIGGGVAVPHARHPDVDDCLLAVGIAPEGIEFDAVDDEPVYLVFLLLGAPDKPSQTIEALADIGLLVQIPNVYDRLISARDPEDVIQIINEAHEEQ
ncbi:MAG: PTS sugar transporter subunit IIA [Planctomycetes bacterium]|nr:PTS sugar transporter subunit IIA [Planctomycetota bacterium]